MRISQSQNRVRRFLPALPLKWRAKVTSIKEAKDMATLPLDELIDNFKVYEMVLENDGVVSKTTKEKGNRSGRNNRFGNGANRFERDRGNGLGNKGGYSQTSKAYIVLNKETIRIEESFNINFDESFPDPKSSPSVEYDRINEPIVQDLVRSLSLEVKVSEPGYAKCVKEVRSHPIEQVNGKLNVRTLRSKTKQA
uniref:UBN2 domain-containing protein n=1 Tax=Tanacetum cinerariifolium TaxID=118510 RepID=A0A6L2JRK9_TANCI|nr:UBN2 domain-containing protein [Tanacetum cinerariifolium]GEW57973.1 UBN2 domain-containing protein [Tanacetum cinerariifolium]